MRFLINYRMKNTCDFSSIIGWRTRACLASSLLEEEHMRFLINYRMKNTCDFSSIIGWRTRACLASSLLEEEHMRFLINYRMKNTGVSCIISVIGRKRTFFSWILGWRTHAIFSSTIGWRTRACFASSLLECNPTMDPYYILLYVKY